MLSKASIFIALFIQSISAWPAVPPSTAQASPPLTSCQSGSTFVQNNILYDCKADESGQPHAKPIGCAPEGDKDKAILKPGETFTTEHFKYHCDEENSALVLKVIS